ncbi:MAG: Gfo/Idh/MocA family oxidoreductase [Armatimonadota bacterium]
MTDFAIIGGGWRAEFFLRVAAALSDQFRVTGMLTRDAAKGAALETTWQVPTFRSLDELLQTAPQFVVVSVPRTVAPDLLVELAERGVPALSETPPASDLDALVALFERVGGNARIQVAEQYLFQPQHAARLAFSASGRLGSISQAQVSVAHGYHGISLLRHFLGVGFEDAVITARTHSTPIVDGPNRNGPPAEDRIVSARQTIAEFDFGDRFGIYDFTDAQYFSWIRSPRLLVRGERGEINGDEIRYLQDFQTPVSVALKRDDTGQNGNLEGYYHRGILAGTEWLYRNPFPPARLSDDEIAVATCLQKMAEYTAGGPDFYSLAEASQDHYLALLVEQAVKQQAPVATIRQPWAGLPS